MGYIVRIEREGRGRPEIFSFRDLPIRVGRNKLNELALEDAFVSQFHGLFSREGAGIVYRDLGSTNGTVVNGQRLAAAKECEIRGNHEDRIVIGPLTLSITESASVDALPDEAFRRQGAHFDAGKGGGRATVAMSSSQKTAVAKATMLLGHGPGPGAPIDEAALHDALRKTKPAYDAYRRAFAEVDRQLRARLEGQSLEMQQAVLAHLVDELPALAHEPGLSAIVEELGLDLGAAHPADPVRWLDRLRGSSADAPQAAEKAPRVSTALAMERVGAVLVSMSSAFVEMRRAYEEFTSELGIATAPGDPSIEQAKDATSLLRRLLDWDQDGPSTIRALENAYARLAVHQIAMMNAVVTGVRSLLDEISPTKLSGESSLALAVQGGASFFSRVLPFRRAQLWSEFATAHEGMVEEDRFTNVMFGRTFARTYLGVSGGTLEAREEARQSAASEAPLAKVGS